MLGRVPEGSKKQILIVDDDPDIRNMVQFILEKGGYLTACAEDGAGALKRLELEPFDLIILDLSMPHMTGQDFISRLVKAKSKIPVLIITAQANPALTFQQLSSQYKPLDILIKPFLPGEILEKVEKFVES